MATNHISKIPTENVIVVKKCLLLAKISNLMSKFVNDCYNIKSKIDCKSGKMLVLWVDNAFSRVFTNLCSNWADRILSERSLDKFGHIDVKIHDSLIELLIAEKSRYTNNDV